MSVWLCVAFVAVVRMEVRQEISSRLLIIRYPNMLGKTKTISSFGLYYKNSLNFIKTNYMQGLIHMFNCQDLNSYTYNIRIK